jgi:hypothetical protein
MIIWRGWGILVAVIAFLGLLAGQLVGTAIFGPAGYERNATWLVGVGLLVAAAVLWPIGQRMNSGAQVLVDKATGQEVILKPGHSLFFIPVQYWSPILAVIAVLMIIVGIIGR